MRHSLNRVAHWAWFPFGVVLRFIARSGRRIAVTAAGFLLFLAGIVMMVTPGPGIVLIIAGLAVLATEYVFKGRRTNLRAGSASQVFLRSGTASEDEDAGHRPKGTADVGHAFKTRWPHKSSVSVAPTPDPPAPFAIVRRQRCLRWLGYWVASSASSDANGSACG